ncbi:hypothetical protein LCGC14_3111290, partial [marine sediment metagenome]
MRGLKMVESVGIELEVENISRGKVPMAPIGDVLFSLTRDASCETELNSFSGIRVDKGNVKKIYLDNRVFGLELISGVMDTETDRYKYILKNLCNRVISLGETPRSYRAGFHVHVNTPLSLEILKSIIRLGRNLEQVFFLVGCMGYDYRGKRNDSTYCRPITKVGPPCVPLGNNSNRRYGKVIHIPDLLKSETVNEFKLRYGDLDKVESTHGRYIPIRYHWLNLTNLWGKGSLEFRVFNKSLNSTFLYSVIELCKAFALYAIESSFSSLKDAQMLGERSVFDITYPQQRDIIIKKFLKFA